MTDRTEAARATREYFVNTPDCDHFYVVDETDPSCELEFQSYEEAQAAFDRLNLLAVLEALGDPSEEMTNAAEAVIWGDDCMVVNVWRAMIGELIAEVRESGACRTPEELREPNEEIQ